MCLGTTPRRTPSGREKDSPPKTSGKRQLEAASPVLNMYGAMTRLNRNMPTCGKEHFLPTTPRLTDIQGRHQSDSSRPMATDCLTWPGMSGSGAPINTISSRTTKLARLGRQKILGCPPQLSPEVSAEAPFCAILHTVRATDLRPACRPRPTLQRTTWAFVVSATNHLREKTVPRQPHEHLSTRIVELNSDGLNGHQCALTHSRAPRVCLGFFPSLR